MPFGKPKEPKAPKEKKPKKEKIQFEPELIIRKSVKVLDDV